MRLILNNKNKYNISCLVNYVFSNKINQINLHYLKTLENKNKKTYMLYIILCTRFSVI